MVGAGGTGGPEPSIDPNASPAITMGQQSTSGMVRSFIGLFFSVVSCF